MNNHPPASVFDDSAASWDDRPHAIELATAFADEIRQTVQPNPEMTALEFGCGTGLVSVKLRNELGKIILLDNSEGMIGVLRRKIFDASLENMTPVLGEISALPGGECQFDLIYALMSIHHIENVHGLFAELSRLLKPGGKLCVGDLETEDGTFHSNPEEIIPHHGFTPEKMDELSNNNGLKLIETHRFYLMPREKPDGSTRHYPLFFMLAEKYPAQSSTAPAR